MGAVGGASQSSAVSKVSESISTSLTVQPSATGGIPKFHPSMSAPRIAVGGGGAGAKDQQHSTPPSGSGFQTKTDEVGQMAEESRESSEQIGKATDEKVREPQQGTVLRERRSDEPPNPKKRMWQGDPNPPAQGDAVRDEL